MENHWEQKLLHRIRGCHANVKKKIKKKTATICDIGFAVGQGMVRKGLLEAGKIVPTCCGGPTFEKLSFVNIWKA